MRTKLWSAKVWLITSPISCMDTQPSATHASIAVE